MNIARALGDKFLKEEDSRFSSTPFVSEVLEISQESRALAVMARYFKAILSIMFIGHVQHKQGIPIYLPRLYSDGLWDVLSQRRALQIAVEVRRT